MYQKLSNFTYRLEQNKLFASVKSGLIFLIPVLAIGSVALAIKNFPLPAFTNFLNQAAGGLAVRALDLIYDATLGMMAVYLTCSIAFCLAASYQDTNSNFQIMAIIASLSCFLISFGAPLGAFRFADFGALGIATAILCALASPILLRFFNRRFALRFRSYAAGADSQFQSVISMMPPLMLTILIFAFVCLAVQLLTNAQNLNEYLSNTVVYLFENVSNELLQGIIFLLLSSGLWFFGMHGGNILEQVSQSFFVPAIDMPERIINKSFLDSFALMGGSGATLCLLLSLLLFSRNKSNRRLAWFAVPFSLFNMNELLIFGIPIILNPMLLLPFLLTPILSLCIAYFATVMGFLPVVHETVVWTAPIFFNGYATTNSFHGIIVQLITLAAGTALYAPFIRLSEHLQYHYERSLLDDFTGIFWKEYGTAAADNYLGRSGRTGVMAKRLALQLEQDISQNNVPVFFQPQFDAKRKIVGAETLLRWKYHDMTIAPPITCQIAKEIGAFDRLTALVLKQAAADMHLFRKNTQADFSLSVNVTARQISDRKFIDSVIELVTKENITAGFCLELIENESIENYDNLNNHLALLNTHGIQAAIDDFSMGTASIKYLQNSNFQYVKLGGDLVKQLKYNDRSMEIVRSIVSLGNDLGFRVIAEYVETELLLDLLIQAGCRYFQGFLCSPAIPANDFVELQRQS